MFFRCCARLIQSKSKTVKDSQLHQPFSFMCLTMYKLQQRTNTRVKSKQEEVQGLAPAEGIWTQG